MPSLRILRERRESRAEDWRIDERTPAPNARHCEGDAFAKRDDNVGFERDARAHIKLLDYPGVGAVDHGL